MTSIRKGGNSRKPGRVSNITQWRLIAGLLHHRSASFSLFFFKLKLGSVKVAVDEMKQELKSETVYIKGDVPL